MWQRYAFLRDGETPLSGEERLAQAAKEVSVYNKLLFGGEARPKNFKRHKNAVFASYLRRVITPVGRAMVVDRGRAGGHQLYKWRATNYIKSGAYIGKPVEAVSPWLAKEIRNCCTKEAMTCPCDQVVYVGMLVALPENDKDFKGNQKVNGGAMELVELYLDPRENKGRRPGRGAVWELVHPPSCIIVRPLRPAGHGEVVVGLPGESYAGGENPPDDPDQVFTVPKDCYMLIPKKNIFNFKLKVPLAVAHAHGLESSLNSEGELVIPVYRTGFHMAQALATTMHALQGANINDAAEPSSRRGGPPHPLIPTHLLWDPFGARDAGNYITITRLNSLGGLTLMSELSARELCKRSIDNNLFAEEKELENDAATTKLLYSDDWLRSVAPKWAGENMS